MKPVEKLGVTPGKWHLEVSGDDFAEIWSGSGRNRRIVAQLGADSRSIADARIMACSKEMYSCLREAGQYIKYSNSKFANRIAKVLEKAGGVE